MTSNDPSKNSATQENSPPDKLTSQPAMSDYLQAPKKKKKSFVAFGVGANFDIDTAVAIQKFFETQYPHLVLVMVRSGNDLVKLATKNVVLILTDDELTQRSETLLAVRQLKEKRSSGPLPTLFFTKDTPALIMDYQNLLPLWHEVDDYLTLSETPRHVLFEKIKAALDKRSKRRARRFKSKIPVCFQVLDTGEHRFQGEIHDFSLHGALISASSNTHQFSLKDQMVLHFPLSQYIHGKADFLRVSARVRRVLIAGNRAGISWEYLTPEKVATLTEILATIVNSGLARAAASTRQKYGKFLEDSSDPTVERTKTT
jgi:hypothetical protein